MDPLSDIMNLISARSYVTVGLAAEDKWSAQFSPFDGLKVICIRKGIFWLKSGENETWHELRSGDGIILTDGETFSMCTKNGDKKTLINSKELTHTKDLGIINYGDDTNVLLAGRMSVNQLGNQLFKKELPAIMPFSTGSSTSSTLNWLLKQLLQESTTQGLGTIVASNHLMHLIILEILRIWIITNEDTQSRWFNAIKDDRIAKTISVIHQNPSKDWSLSELAEISNLSKSGISQKFNQLLGLSPLKYVTYWRMQIAIKALYQGNTSIKDIAFSLGYNAESTFSTAFKRVHHISPSAYRENIEYTS
ncbi:AraC family transcriptional regulator [Acinetobacter nectaris]|uniref:AraC family transcriptional regulator n=1 Tax=Acinetobacter nectaris TaxID=1219382 RepID=UPI001F30D923|nr:AraC family transcriptional regulator [Acinetobacter nectaris]MCF9046708.1 helix-turn-helix transcriptional regulator [Acinetobacter nectaris]